MVGAVWPPRCTLVGPSAPSSSCQACGQLRPFPGASGPVTGAGSRKATPAQSAIFGSACRQFTKTRPPASIWSSSEGSPLWLNCSPLRSPPQPGFCTPPPEGGPEFLPGSISESVPHDPSGDRGFQENVAFGGRPPGLQRRERERDLGSGGRLRVPGAPDSNVNAVKELEVGQEESSEDETRGDSGWAWKIPDAEGPENSTHV